MLNLTFLEILGTNLVHMYLDARHCNVIVHVSDYLMILFQWFIHPAAVHPIHDCMHVHACYVDTLTIHIHTNAKNMCMHVFVVTNIGHMYM